MIRTTAASVLALAVMAVPAVAHVDQAKPPALKQSQKLKLVNKWQRTKLARTDRGFRWAKIENRFRTIWRKKNPPRPHSHWNTAGAPRYVIQCESGGNYSAVNGAGYYGAYQFDLRTWASVGGTGYPHHTSPAEQDHRAALLYQARGSAPWPSCG